MRRASPAVFWFFAGALAALAPRAASAQSSGPTHGVTLLPTTGGATNAAFSISCTTFPIMVGSSANASGAVHAFSTNVGAGARDLGTLGGLNSDARASSCGPILGAAQTDTGAWHAYVTSGNSLVDLGTLGGSESHANAISPFIANVGYVIVGGSKTSDDAAWRAFIVRNSSMSDLGATLGGSSTYANGINAPLHVVGWAELTGGGHHAFLYVDGQTTDLGSLGGNSEALAINDSDVVVGAADVSGTSATHAFRYQSGSFQDLGTLGGASSRALGINSRGDIVGSSLTADGSLHAFLWRDGVMTDLNADSIRLGLRARVGNRRRRAWRHHRLRPVS